MSDELLRAKPEKYQVNRGIGKPVEFKGLKSQYLFIFCGGLLAVFVVFIVLFMAGVNQWLCIGFIVSASLLLVWQTFRLNAKYGTHGLMKAAARKRHPRFIISRKAIPRLFTYKKERKKDHEKYVKGYHAGKEISLWRWRTAASFQRMRT